MRRGVWLVVPALLVAGCTSGPAPSPPPGTDAARQVADRLAGALEQKDLTPVAFADTDGAAADALFQPLVRGMGPVAPEVDVADVSSAADQVVKATLAYRWTFPGVPTPWTYEATVDLRRQDGTWRPVWSPALLQPRLDGSNRLTQRRLRPARGELLGEDGEAVVQNRPVVRIGIDKASLPDAQQERSARRLARLVGIGEDSYVQRVERAGPQAFVLAITFRAQDPRRPSNKEVFAVPGALPLQDEAMLAPTSEFAAALVGQVGDATLEVVEASDGAVTDGDQVGLSGLQKRYDEQLRGTPGVTVGLVATSGVSPSPGATPDDVPSVTPAPEVSTPLFEAKPVDGEPLGTTLNVGLQELAERSLAKSSGPASLVAVRPSSGEVLAVANDVDTDRQPVANAGQVQPGSTFKVVSALALLRAGLEPSSSVDCPRTITVDGRTYENYDDYPAADLGRIDLGTAFAQSCNTAFIGQRDKLGKDDLQDAAGSLGIGTDYDVGFPAYFGAVPTGGDPNVRAEAIFGQGEDQVSPLAMALAAASVQAGRTVLPTLVVDQTPTSTAEPLTRSEAEALKALMREVVTSGSGARLADLDGPAVIAKTGTAEYGGRTPPKTHAWMIAAQGDLAVAVFVQDGTSGSETAGPLLETFLRGAR